MSPLTRFTRRLIAATLGLLLLAQLFNTLRPYECQTDTECEAEAAARCLFFCER